MPKGTYINKFYLKTEHVVGDSLTFEHGKRLMPTEEYRYPKPGEFFAAGKAEGDRVWYCYGKDGQEFAEYYILDFIEENKPTADQWKTLDIIKEVLSKNRSETVFFTEKWRGANLYLYYGDEPGARTALQIIYPDGSLS